MARYRLAKPEKLLRFLGIVVGAIILISLISNLFSGIRSKNETAAEEESSTYTRIETFSMDKTGTQDLGHRRSVSSVPIDSVGNQLAVYMSSMVMSNLENVKDSVANYMSTSDDPLVGYDPLNYKYVVAINPYRGGAERGNVYGSNEEKDLTLTIAKLLVDYLNVHNDGYYFVLVREDDIAMTDGARLSLAEAYSVDLMVTLKINADDDERGGTVGVYYSKQEEWDDTYHNDDEKLEITDEQKVRDALSAKLAEKLMDACAEGFGMWSRFPEENNSPMTNTPYISCEVYMGYLTYEFDRNLMTDSEKQASAAQAMGDCILDFIKDYCSTRVPTEKNVSNVETVDGLDQSRVGSSDGSTLKTDSSETTDDED